MIAGSASWASALVGGEMASQQKSCAARGHQKANNAIHAVPPLGVILVGNEVCSRRQCQAIEFRNVRHHNVRRGSRPVYQDLLMTGPL